MKKIVLMATAIFIGYVANATESTITMKPSIVVVSDWMKSKDGTWEGIHEGKTVWYKLNPKDASLWWSTDGKKWEAVKDGMWQDKEGKWLKIDHKDLKWSADGGKTWSGVPEWQWEGPNGTWYKFDKDWSLWTKSGKM